MHLRGTPHSWDLTPTQQLFKSYKSRLISFHLNNKCFGYKAWDAWFRTQFQVHTSRNRFFNKTIYIYICTLIHTHAHRGFCAAAKELEMMEWAWHQGLLTCGTTHPKAAEDLDYFFKYQSPKVSPRGAVLRQSLKPQFSRKFHMQVSEAHSTFWFCRTPLLSLWSLLERWVWEAGQSRDRTGSEAGQAHTQTAVLMSNPAWL